MLFTLKKFISWWLEPANVCLVLLVPGIVLLWTKRYQRVGRGLLSAGLVVLAIFSNGAVARWMALSLESQYPPIPDIAANTPLPPNLASIRYVAVLGGGGADTAGFSANNKLPRAALQRLIEGVRLVRSLPETKLIVSGAGMPGETSNAELMKQAAISLGIEPSRIMQFDSPRDTMDEAAAIETAVGNSPFILVTSALHMPRAAALMRRKGMNPLPAPADYLVRPDEPFRFQNQLWGAGAIETTSAALHEYIGMIWARVRGREARPGA